MHVISLMGMITVVSIVANNGILMLDAVEDNLAATGDLTQGLFTFGTQKISRCTDELAPGILRMAALTPRLRLRIGTSSRV